MTSWVLRPATYNPPTSTCLQSRQIEGMDTAAIEPIYFKLCREVDATVLEPPMRLMVGNLFEASMAELTMIFTRLSLSVVLCRRDLYNSRSIRRTRLHWRPEPRGGLCRLQHPLTQEPPTRRTRLAGPSRKAPVLRMQPAIHRSRLP